MQQDDIKEMAAGVQGAPFKVHLGEEAFMKNSSSGVNDRQSPLGYLTQVNQNTMINLNNNNIVSNQEATVTPQKGRVKMKKNS